MPSSPEKEKDSDKGVPVRAPREVQGFPLEPRHSEMQVRVSAPLKVPREQKDSGEDVRVARLGQQEIEEVVQRQTRRE